MNQEYSEEKLNKLKTEFPNIPEVFIKRVLRCHDVAANPESFEIVRKELRRFQGIQTPQGKGGVFKKWPNAGQREVPKGGSIAECGGVLAGRHVGDQKRTDDATQEECKAKIDDEVMKLEYSEETLNKLKTEFPNIPEVFIKRVLRCHDVAANPENLEIVRKELRGFQGTQTPQGRGGVFKKQLSAEQREVPIGRSIAECGGDLAGRHVGDQKRTGDATQEECRAKIDDEVMKLEYSEETLNKLKTEFPNIPEVFIKRVLRCHDVAANPENLEIVRKELRGFQGTQTPQGRGGVFKKQLSAEQREVPIGRSIAECGGDLAGRHVGDQKRTGDATQEECRAKIDDEVMKLEYSEETLNKLKTEFPNIPEVFIKRVLRCHDVAANPENLEIVRKELRGFQGTQTPQGRGGVFKKQLSAEQREVPIGRSIAECGGDLAGRHVGDQKRTDDATQEECRAKIDDEVMKLEYSEETLNKLKTEFPNIPEVFIKRVLRCHDVAANPESLEIVRKELWGFQGIQTPQGRGGVFKKRPSAGQREVPKGGSIAECGGDLAGRHVGDQKRTDDATQEECRAKIGDEVMKLEYSEETLNKLKTEFPNIPEVFIKRVLRCHGVAANPENLEGARKELRGFQDIQAPQGREEVFKKRPRVGQREVPIGGSKGGCEGDLAGRHLSDQKSTNDATQEECRAKIDGEIMNLEYSDETLNKLKTEFPNIPEVFVKRVLRCHDVVANPENLESARKELREFRDIQTPQRRGGIFKKQPSAGQREVPIGGSLDECREDLLGLHLSEQKRRDDAIQEECRSICADDEFGPQLPVLPRNLNRSGDPPPNKPKSWQGPTRKAQDISTKNQGEYEGCPSERGACKDNYQGVYDDLRLIVTQLANSWVKIAENGKVEEDFVFSGNKVGIERALNTIVAGVTCKTIDIKQPGLRKFYASGKGDLLEKTIEKNYECAIHVQKSFDSKREEGKVQGTQAGSNSTSSDDDDEPVTSGDDDNDDEWEAVVSETDRSSFATEAGHQVSWRAGIIEAEKVS